MKRASNLRWLCAAVAPWAVAAGLLVSFTAVARNDPNVDLGVVPAYRNVPAAETRLIAKSARFARGSAPAPSSGADAPVRETALRLDLKLGAGDFPAIDRTGKGGTGRELAPALSRVGLDLARARVPTSQRLAFARDERVLPPTVLMRGPIAGPDWASSRGLQPWSGDDPTLTSNGSSVQSPAAAAAGSTGAARAPSRQAGNGATPAVPRAAALSSATPAPSDAVPHEIAAAPVSVPPRTAVAVVPRPEIETRSRYADLLAPDSLERERRCLAEVVYFEARSEPEDGQAAVAQVVLNRVRSGLYPSSVCGVVYQNRQRHLACQFTFACEGKTLRITEPDAWETAKRVARDVTEGRTYLADVGGATHYHADYVTPYWARRLRRMDVIGRHVFYQLKPGQT